MFALGAVVMLRRHDEDEQAHTGQACADRPVAHSAATTAGGGRHPTIPGGVGDAVRGHRQGLCLALAQ
ncbi:MAG: hypothetical protein DLM62_19520 [Pseudonocardiales bacterium]|nr:MAG: hypothetical protein DLM62_19520 [Pseudonocardiales bacterium]